MEAAQDRIKFARLVKMLSHATNVRELESMSILYILDPSYSRADISLAIKQVELDKGWT